MYVLAPRVSLAGFRPKPAVDNENPTLRLQPALPPFAATARSEQHPITAMRTKLAFAASFFNR